LIPTPGGVRFGKRWAHALGLTVLLRHPA
jgi:hypothetical protein